MLFLVVVYKCLFYSCTRSTTNVTLAVRNTPLGGFTSLQRLRLNIDLQLPKDCRKMVKLLEDASERVLNLPQSVLVVSMPLSTLAKKNQRKIKEKSKVAWNEHHKDGYCGGSRPSRWHGGVISIFFKSKISVYPLAWQMIARVADDSTVLSL